MTHAERLAAFVMRASYDDLSEVGRQQLKVRVLDSLGCAIGALEGEPIRMLRVHLKDFGGTEHCTLIGGGRTAPDRAAFYNSALVRYLDFNEVTWPRARPATLVITWGLCWPLPSTRTTVAVSS